MNVVDRLAKDSVPYGLVNPSGSDKTQNEIPPILAHRFDPEDVGGSEVEFHSFELTRGGIDSVELLHGKAQLRPDTLET